MVCSEATFLHSEYRDAHRGDTDFDQANKKDACEVTQGQHTMSTTKKGKLIHRNKPYSARARQEMRNIYKTGSQLGRLGVEYRMAHTLEVHSLKTYSCKIRADLSFT